MASIRVCLAAGVVCQREDLPLCVCVCVCRRERVCVASGETLKKKKPCWFSMQMTALVVTKALMLGLEKWSDSVTTPGHFRHVFVYSCFIPFAVAITQMFPNFPVFTPLSLFGVSKGNVWKNVNKTARWCRCLYFSSCACRYWQRDTVHMKERKKASALTSELVISKCAHCNLNFRINSWSEHVPGAVWLVQISFVCYCFFFFSWGGVEAEGEGE